MFSHCSVGRPETGRQSAPAKPSEPTAAATPPMPGQAFTDASAARPARMMTASWPAPSPKKRPLRSNGSKRYEAPSAMAR